MKEKYNRNPFWRFIKCILRIFKRKPKFKFLGEEFTERALYLSNHVGAHGPLTLELYFPKLFRFWGVHDMNDGFGSRFKYLSTTYFHNKKHLPKALAFFIAIFATPVMSVFYWGIRLIPSYNDSRLITTFHKSMEIIESNQSIIIFPENSSDGYHEVLKEYFSGFYVLAKRCFDKGIDLKIYNMYYIKKKNTFVVDKPILFSEIQKLNLPKEKIAEIFKDRANELKELV